VKLCSTPSSSSSPFENPGGIIARRILVTIWLSEETSRVSCYTFIRGRACQRNDHLGHQLRVLLAKDYRIG
jgi:hypothetical protein